jgi:hypothetical protein
MAPDRTENLLTNNRLFVIVSMCTKIVINCRRGLNSNLTVF